MSPPFIDPEAPTKTKKTRSEKQINAARENGKRSRGPGPEAKQRIRFKACKHNMMAESEVRPTPPSDLRHVSII